MAPTYTFGPSAAEAVAEELGLEVDEDTGLLVEKDTGKPAIPAGQDEPITLEEFGGMAAGSKVPIEDDFNSVSAYVEDYLNNDRS